MQIIISPAKKMRIDNDDLVSAAEPQLFKRYRNFTGRAEKDAV